MCWKCWDSRIHITTPQRCRFWSGCGDVCPDLYPYRTLMFFIQWFPSPLWSLWWERRRCKTRWFSRIICFIPTEENKKSISLKKPVWKLLKLLEYFSFYFHTIWNFRTFGHVTRFSRNIFHIVSPSSIINSKRTLSGCLRCKKTFMRGR